jgi:pimeloyl-ACP methyl ester carboxylesterase
MPLPSVDEWRAAGHTFRFRGHEVFMRVAGQGPALLLIHGFPTAGWDWCKLWPELSMRFTLVAPDLLGFGFSAKPPRHDYRIAEQADLCLSALAEAGIGEVHVLAHDYGDTVAQELLARAGEGRCPVVLRSVVLLNGGLFPEAHRPVFAQRLLRSPLGPLVAGLMTRDRLARTMRRIAGSLAPPGDPEIDVFWALLSHSNGRRALPRLIRYIDERREQRERWVGALQRTRVPILLIDGTKDPISGAHMVARFRELVPAAPVVELPGVGHYPQIEAPVAVLGAALRAFDAASPVPSPAA